MRESVNLVQMNPNAGKPTIRAAALIPFKLSRDELIDNPKTLKDLLKPVFKQTGFSKKEVVTCLPPSFFKVLLTSYKPGTGISDDEAIVEAIKERVDGDLSDYILDFIPVRTADNSEEKLALVSVSPREQVVRYLECLRKAGLKVAALEIGPIALNRLLGLLASENDYENTLSINFGDTSSYLSVHGGRRLLLDREVNIGESQLISELSHALDIDEALARRVLHRDGISVDSKNDDDQAEGSDSPVAADENKISQKVLEILKPQLLAMVAEINKATVYAASQSRGKPVSRIYILGSVARWPNADKLFRSLVDIPISVLDPIANYQPMKAKLMIPEQYNNQCLGVATGLALREI
ncbi:MAG: pilus assembly protein PilM [Proteobacteria bacterium]|nr:pilus assembly protein PilM [Pseudomonadota bacterium]